MKKWLNKIKKYRGLLQEFFAAIPRPLLFAILVTTLIEIILLSSIGGDLQKNIQHPVEFRLRSDFGLDPELSPQIKVYSFEDKTLASLGTTEIPLKIWGGILKGLSDAGAEFIFIDKLFGTPGSDKEIIAFGELIASLPSKIVIGSFITQNAVFNKDEIKLPESSLVAEKSSDFEHDEIFHVYGAPKILQPYFKYFGHVNYRNDNMVRPVYPVSKKSSAAGAVFWAAEQLTTKNGSLYINNKKIPVNSDGDNLINLASMKTYEPRNFAFKSLYFRARDGVAMSLKEQEKYVVIMLESYTGGTDFVETAHGSMPGGFTHVATLNSLLTNNWLTTASWQWAWFLLAAIFGYYLANRFKAKIFLLLGVSIPLLITLLGIASFLLLNLQIPWVGCVLAFSVVGSVVFVEKSRIAEIASLLLKKDLELGSSAQNLFLPERLKGEIFDFEYSITFEPFGPLSGDWVQTFFHESFSVIAIGDVVGKGPSAALNTSVIAAIWSQHCEKWEKNAEVDFSAFLNDLNRTIFKLFQGKQFTTLSGILFQDNKIFTINAGAPPWLNMIPGEGFKVMRNPPLNPIGSFAQTYEVKLTPAEIKHGEVLANFTDGVLDGGGYKKALKKQIMAQEAPLTHHQCERIVREVGEANRVDDDYTLLLISKK